MNKKPSHKRHIALWTVLALIVAGAGWFTFQEIHYRQRAAADKVRFESALTDMNKFFDALGNRITNKKVSQYCSYDKGPWGDMNKNNPLCSVKVVATSETYNKDKELFSEKIILLGWSTTVGINASALGGDYYGGERDSLSCNLTIKDKTVTAICYGRTAFQHYPRVDR